MILKNQEVHWVKLDPARPERGMGSPGQPGKLSWNLQLRTTKKEVYQQWKALGLKPKVVREDKNDEESKVSHYICNVRKSAESRDGKKPTPVTVVNGRQEPVDPNTIANESICNISLFERKYKLEGQEKTQMILTGVQVVLHKVRKPFTREEFEDCETTVEMPAESSEAGGDDDDDTPTPSGAAGAVDDSLF